MNLAFVLSFICFLYAALAPIFDWHSTKFDAIAWGLALLVLGMLWVYDLPTRRRPPAG